MTQDIHLCFQNIKPMKTQKCFQFLKFAHMCCPVCLFTNQQLINQHPYHTYLLLYLILFVLGAHKAIICDGYPFHFHVSAVQHTASAYFSLLTSLVTQMGFPQDILSTCPKGEDKDVWTFRFPYIHFLLLPSSLCFFYCKILHNIVKVFPISPGSCHLGNLTSQPFFSHLP